MSAAKTLPLTGPFDLGVWATQHGWATAGVTGPEVSSEERLRYMTWLQEKKGPQMKYLERRAEERLSPEKYFPKVQAILCFGLYYFPGWAKGEVKVSNYSWGKDYHLVLKEKLEATAKALQKEVGEFNYRLSVDTAPVLEKTFAVKAGLGWQGKNTLLLNRHHGSFLFLGEILSDLPLEKFQAALPVSDHCGRCTRCIDACPTQALSPYELDAKKCISYWTLEHKGNFESSTPKWKDWIAGCDICQEVCPWNQKLIPLSSPDISSPLSSLKASEISDSHWPERIREQAISYVSAQAWQRNLNHISQ